MDVFKKYKTVWMIFIAFVFCVTVILAIAVNTVSKSDPMFGGCFSMMSNENSTFNSWNMKYSYLNGAKNKSVELNSGNELTINYSSRVKKGSLEILLLDTRKHKIKNLLEGQSGKFKYTANESGKYYVEVVGNKTSGQFNLDWHIK